MNKPEWLQLENIFKKNLKNDGRYTAWRLASIGIMGFLGLSVIATIYFIYNTTYNTISNNNAILILNNGSQNNSADMEAYEQAKNIIAKKQLNIDIPDNLRNIFNYGQELPKPATSTKK